MWRPRYRTQETELDCYKHWWRSQIWLPSTVCQSHSCSPQVIWNSRVSSLPWCLMLLSFCETGRVASLCSIQKLRWIINDLNSSVIQGSVLARTLFGANSLWLVWLGLICTPLYMFLSNHFLSASTTKMPILHKLFHLPYSRYLLESIVDGLGHYILITVRTISENQPAISSYMMAM